jgi:hypothetical protein
MLTLTTSLVLFLSTMTTSDAQTVSQTSQTAAIVETVSNEVLTTDNISVNQLSKQSTDIEKYVRSYFAKTPILAEVAKCESRFKQFKKDGSVLRGILTPADVGVMQINEYYHKTTADKLGIDLHTLEGNLKYAEYLYKRSGTQPWSASQYCWDK